MNYRNTIPTLIAATAAQLAFATPSITDVTAQQRYPWNGKVDISYTVSGMDNLDDFKKEYGLLALNLKVSAIDYDSGVTNVAMSVSGDMALTNGTHNIVWDMNADGLSLVSTAVVFSVSCEMTPATYCVIDLSGGRSASSYPVTYLAEPPDGGFNVDVYKKTKLVLRRIEPGSFMMCGQYQTTLTKPYFIGIFEMTQKQYTSVAANSRSWTHKGDMRPVDGLLYSTLRGSSNGARWPSSPNVDSDSFMGLLRSRTGLAFDLPTEAQWEYACRAGTTSQFNNGGDTEEDLNIVGIYKENYKTGQGGYTFGSAIVGSYLPNNWGLYDMHGNEWEWCLDWDSGTPVGGSDPVGSLSGTERVARGGAWNWDAIYCTSSSRRGWPPANGLLSFRLARSLPAEQTEEHFCGNAMPIAIDLTPGVRIASSNEPIRYSTAWETNLANAQLMINVNGKELLTASGSGFLEWRPTSNGTYSFTHSVFIGEEQIGQSLIAIFEVTQCPNMPIISPADRVVEGWPISVIISCSTEGATIHYTTDGTEPTAESPIYRRFRISERTTVKAVAIKDGFCSKTAVAEYAIGQCANPIITPADGTTFDWAGQEISIAWQGEDGVLRYTTDGSDPTTNSPVYVGPFTIDDSTVVKAKAFGDLCLDSAVVTANIVRVWANVATPAITAAASFTGSETKVELSCATPCAVIRYTLNGNNPNSHSTRYTGPFYVAESCTVKAYATCYDYRDSAVASKAIEKVWVIGDTVGAPDHTFATGGDLPFVRVTDNTAPLGESMKSGAITHSQTSTLSTTVTGPGTISFQWKVSCEEDPDDYYEWDHAEFWVDGTRIAQLDGETAWQTVTQAISGNGLHTLLWKYVKDEVESEGEDCCWVADYHWATAYTETQTTPAHVPYVWLRSYFPHTPDEYDFYETAAKATAANGVNKVWECSVAGVNPTNAADVFRAIISMENGAPVVGWEPDLNEGGTKHERVYTVEGKENLTDKSWAPTNSASRFFRVKVEMP